MSGWGASWRRRLRRETLEPWEATECLVAAQQIVKFREGHDCMDARNECSQLTNEYNGRVGHYALRKFLYGGDLPLDIHYGDDGGVDLPAPSGHTIQVKAVRNRYPEFYLYVPRGYQIVSDLLALVVVDTLDYWIGGWIWRHEFLKAAGSMDMPSGPGLSVPANILHNHHGLKILPVNDNQNLTTQWHQ